MMTEQTASKLKKTFVILLAAVLLSALFACALIISEEADHDCTGEDCPICALLDICEAALHYVSIGAAAVTALAGLVFFRAVRRAFELYFTFGTLISSKVRINC